MQINIDLTHIHEVVLPKFRELLDDEQRVLILRGGRGSGKSFFWAQKLLYRILKNFDTIKHRFIVLRKTSSNCDRSVVAQIQNCINEWGLQHIVTYNKSSKIFRFINGSMILCTGLDDAEKIKSIYGISSIVLEEATEFTQDDFISLDLSMRGKTKTYFQIILAFNPISITNWIYKAFWINTQDQITYHHSTFEDNEYVGKEYRARLEALVGQNKNAYKILCKGEWGVLEGIIFDNWSTIKEWPEDTEGDTVYGLDWGWNHPLVLVKAAQYKDGYAIDELFYKSGNTVGDLIKQLPELIENKNDYIYCDSARPENVQEVFRAGYNAHPAQKGPGSVKEGIDFVKRKPLYITQRSTNGIKELQTYSWKVDKQGNYLDEPIKEFDDFCFVGDTKIDTIAGKISIKNIRVGDLVLTRVGYKRVTNIMDNGIKEVHTYIIDGNSITVTPDHKIITDKGKVAIKDINKQHIIYVKEDKICQKRLNLMELYIEDIRHQKSGHTEFITDVLANISKKVCPSYIEISTDYIKGIYQRVFIYTTKTATHLITRSKILKQLIHMNTYHTTLKNGGKIIKMLYSSISRKSGRLPRNGTHQKKGMSGINNTGKMYLETDHYSLQYAKSAAMHILQRHRGNSAVINVKQKTEETQELTMKQEYAKGVEKSSELTSIQKRNVAQKDVVVYSEEVRQRRVYNITVDREHEYFANNILVCNCDCARYALFSHFHNLTDYNITI